MSLDVVVAFVSATAERLAAERRATERRVGLDVVVRLSLGVLALDLLI